MIPILPSRIDGHDTPPHDGAVCNAAIEAASAAAAAWSADPSEQTLLDACAAIGAAWDAYATWAENFAYARGLDDAERWGAAWRSFTAQQEDPRPTATASPVDDHAVAGTIPDPAQPSLDAVRAAAAAIVAAMHDGSAASSTAAATALLDRVSPIHDPACVDDHDVAAIIGCHVQTLRAMLQRVELPPAARPVLVPHGRGHRRTWTHDQIPAVRAALAPSEYRPPAPPVPSPASVRPRRPKHISAVGGPRKRLIDSVRDGD